MKEKYYMRRFNAGEQNFDDQAQKVRVVAATENPVRIWDWEKKEVIEEVLLLDGVVLPEGNRVPLLDSHNRYSVSGVLGSARNFGVNGNALECDVVFSETGLGKETAIKVREGHLTDFSVGYESIESVWASPDETKSVGGRVFLGPLKVTTRWKLKELSITPIGADESAKVREGRADSYKQYLLKELWDIENKGKENSMGSVRDPGVQATVASGSSPDYGEKRSGEKDKKRPLTISDLLYFLVVILIIAYFFI